VKYLQNFNAEATQIQREKWKIKYRGIRGQGEGSFSFLGVEERKEKLYQKRLLSLHVITYTLLTYTTSAVFLRLKREDKKKRGGFGLSHSMLYRTHHPLFFLPCDTFPAFYSSSSSNSQVPLQFSPNPERIHSFHLRNC